VNVGNVQSLARHLFRSPLPSPRRDSVDPFQPVHTRLNIVTDARVSSSIMTLTLRTALSYTAGLYAENAFLGSPSLRVPYALTPLRPAVKLTVC
jgi:hypothetical protein